MNSTETRPSVGAAQIGIALLALGTASIHLYLFLIEGFLGNGKMLPIYQLLFVGNVFAYVTLATALLLPLSPLARVRSFVRVVLISIAVASIASYFYVGLLDAVGHTAKAIEVLLILLVTVDAATSGAEEDLAGRFAGGATGAAVQLVVGIAVGIVMFLILTPFMV
jgi:glucan phosphoethanolaminetransferase (alkaline phosphatase superfamily)